MLELDVISHTAVSKIQIIGLCRILGCQSIDLLHNRNNTGCLTAVADNQDSIVNVELVFHTKSAGNLEVGKSLNLCLAEQLIIEQVDILAGVQLT